MMANGIAHTPRSKGFMLYSEPSTVVAINAGKIIEIELITIMLNENKKTPNDNVCSLFNNKIKIYKDLKNTYSFSNFE